jgi:hypothetical protein
MRMYIFKSFYVIWYHVISCCIILYHFISISTIYLHIYIYIDISTFIYIYHLLVYLDIFFLVPSHPQCPKKFSLQWHSSCQHIDISVPRAPPEAVEGLVLWWSFFTPLGGSPPTIWLYFRWENMGEQWGKKTMLIHWLIMGGSLFSH